MSVEEQKWEILERAIKGTPSMAYSSIYKDYIDLIERFREKLENHFREEIDKEIEQQLCNCSYGTRCTFAIDEAAMLKLSDIDDLVNKPLEEQTIDNKIASVKKQLKHCKNPMQNKKLNQELNVLYKEKKKQRKFQEKENATKE